MKKKLVGLMLSGMLVLSLAACGGDDAAADSATVSTQTEVSTMSDTVQEAVTTEEVIVNDSTDSEAADSDGILYHLTMEEIPDLADTTWDFAGGMIDGTEMTEMSLTQHCHLLMVDSFPLYLMEMEMHRWYRAEVLSMEPMRSEMTDL